MPGLIRQAARDWARAQAMARVADAAARTSAERAPVAAGRGRSDDARRRVSGDPRARWPRHRARARTRAWSPSTSRTPPCSSVASGSWPRWWRACPARRLLGIVGPSGSGKSSAMRAGLLAAIGAGVLPGSETWARAVIRPGRAPAARAPGGPRGPSRAGRRPVRGALHRLPRRARARGVRRRARSDRARARHDRASSPCGPTSTARCAPYPELSRLLGANHVLVGPMRRDELRRAVELPARHAGVRVEPELVDALIADVEREPGGLPLLSTSLLELWQHRDGRRLRLAAYEQAGRRARRGRAPGRGRLRRGSTPAAAADARRSCCASRARARRRGRARAGRARASSATDARPVLAELTERRLLTVSEGEVEVAHEALLREWPRLRGWLEDDAEGRRLHRHLRAAARDWEAGGRDPGELYRGRAPGLGAGLGDRPRPGAQRDASAPSSPTAGPRASARSAACGSCSPAWPRCWCSR